MADAHPIGERFAHYRVLECLGEGGMGEVFKAVDTRLNRVVALKLVRPGLASSPDALDRLRQEARAVSALSHPNIAVLYELEEASGRTALVFEYLGGGTLRDRLRRYRDAGQAMPADEALGYATALAAALAQAHRQRIIHRDVKPANILLGEDGTPKLTDFGLARFGVDAEITRTLGISGTLAYMSPEQASGRPLDRRTDLYSFGVVLFEMLAGEPPFRGDNQAAVLNGILHGSAPPIRRPDVPPALAAVVAKCLEKDPGSRYASAEELLTDLRAVSGGRSGRAVAERRVWLRAVIWSAVILLVVLAGGPSIREWLWELLPGVRMPAQKQLAVLPFHNIGGHPENQALCDGLTETLSSELSQLEAFHGSLAVSPASEVRSEAIGSVEEARRKLGANLVITGGLQRLQDRLRISINLIDTRSRKQLQSLTIDKPIKNAAELQDSIVEQVAGMLNLENRPEALRALAAGGTRQPAAFQLYLEGMGYLARLDRPDNVDKAIVTFEAASALDAKYAAAYDGLARALWRKFQISGNTALAQQARAACERALRLDPALAGVRVTHGMILRGMGERERALAEFDKALALDPGNDLGLRGRAGLLEDMGQLAAAEATLQNAIKLRPAKWGGYAALGAFYTRQRRLEEAESTLGMLLELVPDNLIGLNNLASVQMLRGRFAEAARLFERALQLKSTTSLLTNLGSALYYQGRFEEAAKYYREAASAAPRRYLYWANLGDALRWVKGRQEESKSAYRRAIVLAEEQTRVDASKWDTRLSLAMYRAKAGECPGALRDLAEAVRLGAEGPSASYRMAQVNELCGSRTEALAALGRAFGAGQPIGEVEREPYLAALRGDTRYQRLKNSLAKRANP